MFTGHHGKTLIPGFVKVLLSTAYLMLHPEMCTNLGLRVTQRIQVVLILRAPFPKRKRVTFP